MTEQESGGFSGTEVLMLRELLARQVVLYRELEGYSHEQGRMVEAVDSQGLITLLGKRQVVLDELGGLARDLGPFRTRWRELWDGLAGEQREAIGGLVDESEALLKGIIDRDERDKASLSAVKEGIGREMKRSHNRGAALNAYQNQSRGVVDPRFTDRRG